jgi:hypothetical protein
MQAVMQGISQIGVVTGHLRGSGAKKGFDEHRVQQILSLLDSAMNSLKGVPETSAADNIVRNIVEAANELVRRCPPVCHSPLLTTFLPFQAGAMLAVHLLPDDLSSMPSASARSPAINADDALQSQAARHAAALKVRPPPPPSNPTQPNRGHL